MTTRFDVDFWVCDVQQSIVAFGGKDAKTPAPPNYAPIAQADTAAVQASSEAAAAQTKLGQDQLDWAKNQFSTVWPYAQNYLNAQISATGAEQGAAENQQAFYDTTYKPIEQKFAQEAQDYASPANTETRAGMAEADVSNTFNAQRANALSNLEGFGIDPSQTRFGALDLGLRVSQAAATAAAGNQSRLNTKATGLALEGEAINTGRGYPSAVANAYNTATNSGSSGLSEANQTTQTGSSTMGSPLGYGQLANSSRAGVYTGLDTGISALNTGFSNALNSDNLGFQIAQNNAQGIGSLIGGGLGIAAGFLRGR